MLTWFSSVRSAPARAVLCAALLFPGLAVASDFTIVAPLKGKTRPDLPCCVPFYLMGTPNISGDYVVFTSRNGPADGIWSYRISTGKLKRLASLKTKVPGGSGKFTAFGNAGSDWPTTVGGSIVAFFGRDQNNTLGIYTVPVQGGTVTPVATTNDVVPGGTDKFTDLGFASLNGKTIAFHGSSVNTGWGIYRAKVNGAAPVKVIDGNEKLTARTPSGPLPNYLEFHTRPIMGKSSLRFFTSGLFDPSTGANALFRAGGGFTDISDNMTALPGGDKDQHVRIGTTSAAVGSDDVAFLADQPNTGFAGLFKVKDLAMASAFVTNDDLPPGGSEPYNTFLSFGYDDTGLAFTALAGAGGRNVQSVYFKRPGKPVVRIAKDGGRYYLPTAGDRSVSNGRIVFYDGSNYADTFYLATPKKK